MDCSLYCFDEGTDNLCFMRHNFFMNNRNFHNFLNNLFNFSYLYNRNLLDFFHNFHLSLIYWLFLSSDNLDNFLSHLNDWDYFFNYLWYLNNPFLYLINRNYLLNIYFNWGELLLNMVDNSFTFNILFDGDCLSYEFFNLNYFGNLLDNFNNFLYNFLDFNNLFFFFSCLYNLFFDELNNLCSWNFHNLFRPWHLDYSLDLSLERNHFLYLYLSKPFSDSFNWISVDLWD